MSSSNHHSGASTECVPTSSLKVRVYQRNGEFTAEVQGGWWVAQGKTAKEAIDRAKARVTKEMLGLYVVEK